MDVTSRSNRQPLKVPSSSPPGSPAATTLILIAVVAALYLGQELLIPLALSILLSFALAPFAIRLRRLGLGRIPSVLLLVVLVFVVVMAFGSLVTSEIASLAQNAGRYEYNFRTKIRTLGEATSNGGAFGQLRRLWVDIDRELERAARPSPDPSGTGARASAGAVEPVKPVPVEVHTPPARPIDLLGQFAGGLLKPLATAGVIVVFVVFFLLQREDLRDRFIRLFGSRDMHRTTDAMTDAARRVSRYLIVQLCINMFYGVSVGFGLWLIGVPHPLLWGLLGGALRFVPYVGPIAAAILPTVVAVAVDPGWIVPLLSVGLFLILELFINNVLEPWLYSSSTGLSPVAILVAAVFWTTLWGPVGLLLSTPLTVCLVVLGRHVPQLEFLEVLLGSEPVLPSEVKFYQRLLAADEDEAAEVAEEFLEENSIEDLFEQVLLPTLVFADQDRLRGVLDRERWNGLASTILEVIDDMIAKAAAEHPPAAADKPLRQGDGEDGRNGGPIVLCLGARNALDDAASAMLAHLLRARGFGARLLPHGSLRTAPSIGMDGTAIDAIAVCYVQSEAKHHARRVIRRLRNSLPSRPPIVLMLSKLETPEEGWREASETAGADRVSVSLSGAVRELEGIIQSSRSLPTPNEAG